MARTVTVSTSLTQPSSPRTPVKLGSSFVPNYWRHRRGVIRVWFNAHPIITRIFRIVRFWILSTIRRLDWSLGSKSIAHNPFVVNISSESKKLVATNWYGFWRIRYVHFQRKTERLLKIMFRQSFEIFAPFRFSSNFANFNKRSAIFNLLCIYQQPAPLFWSKFTMNNWPRPPITFQADWYILLSGISVLKADSNEKFHHSVSSNSIWIRTWSTNCDMK